MLGLTDAEIAEAAMLQEIHEQRAHEAPSPNRGLSVEPSKNAEEEVVPPQSPSETPNVMEEKEEEEEKEDQEDKDSLLSEDPADEDAEPEWLA